MTRANMIVLGLLLPVLGFSEWVKVDDFQSYQPDLLPMQANGWMAADAKVSQVTVCADTLAAGNQAARLHRQNETKLGEHDILFQTGALAIELGKTGTVFLRFLIESGLDKSLGSTRGETPVEPIHVKIAVTEQRLHAGNPRVGVLIQGKESVLTGFGKMRTEGKPLPVRRNRWYRLWLVVDNRPADAGGLSKAFLQEEGVSGEPVEVRCAMESSSSYQPGMLTGVGVLKARDNGLTDLFVDDVFVDNRGSNLIDPLKSGSVMGWREKLLEESKQYAHLLKKPDTRDEAEKQAAKLVEAMKPAERFSLVCGDGHLGLPAFMRLGIPGINFTDASSGINNGNGPVGSRHARTVAHPCTLLLAATWNTELAKAYGQAIGEECHSGGTHVLLGPGMNLYRVSAGGRNFEYMGEDPVLTGNLVENYVRGLQSAGTGATLKHFIANEIEFHRRGSNSQMDERTLHEVYMEPFRKGVEAGAFAVMTSYNQLNGEWAGQSRFVNTDLLRDTLGFRGISMTDWISTYDGVKLAQSGTDLEMPGGGALKKDREKVFGTPDIDRMARRIVAACIFAGFYERPQRDERVEKKRPEWEQTATRVNEEGIVLLKNSGALPLARQQAGKKILVAGNFAQRVELGGDGSGHVKGYNLKTYTQTLKEYFADADVSCVEKPEDAQIRSADWVVLFTGFAGEGEGRDTRFVLPDDELITKCTELNPKTVVCVTSGCGVRMEWADKAVAILYVMFGGQSGPAALADVLTGIVNPSGRLPFTIENRIEDSPGFAVLDPKPDKDRPFATDYIGSYVKGEYFASDDKKSYYVHNVQYSEGVFIGHRWYESKKIPVRYPFGFGLGYTAFAYENLKVDVKGQKATVSFTLKNIGKRPGAEVAQVYVSDKVCSVPRPPQELKAFQKIHIEPGNSQRVEIELGSEAFRFWNSATKKWTIEPGEFEIHVGASSADIRLKEA
ncbi:MAG: glycoside hydrolase family 3 C-terminal domain-containing protein, partial [bacterium]